MCVCVSVRVWRASLQGGTRSRPREEHEQGQRSTRMVHLRHSERLIPPQSSRGAHSFIQQTFTKCQTRCLGLPYLTAASQASKLSLAPQSCSCLTFWVPQTVSGSMSHPLTALPEVYFICLCFKSHPLQHLPSFNSGPCQQMLQPLIPGRVPSKCTEASPVPGAF